MKHKILFLAGFVSISLSLSAGKPEQLRHAVKVDLPESYGAPAVTSVREGVFGVQADGKWTFYNIGGSAIHSALRGRFNSTNPLFDSGALVMKDLDSGTRNNPYVILYSNGSRKKLPAEWKSVTDFVDGVAMVQAVDSEYVPSRFFINTKGEMIWPHLKEVGRKLSTLPTYPVRPLRENRRAFKKGDKWGFLDKNGKVVIEPQFVNVRDFSEEYAGVTVMVDGVPMIGFINLEGKFTFQPVLKGFTHWDAKVGDVHSGRIRVVRDNLDYYDTGGKLLKSFKNAIGTEFLPGDVAWIRTEASLGDTIWLNIVDVHFNIVDKLEDNTGRWGIIDAPIFSKRGLKAANFGREIVNTTGSVVISGTDDFSDNLQDKYAFFGDDAIAYCYAELVVDDKAYYGIVGLDGNYVVIFNRETVPTTWRRLPDTVY